MAQACWHLHMRVYTCTPTCKNKAVHTTQLKQERDFLSLGFVFSPGRDSVVTKCRMLLQAVSPNVSTSAVRWQWTAIES